MAEERHLMMIRWSGEIEVSILLTFSQTSLNCSCEKLLVHQFDILKLMIFVIFTTCLLDNVLI